jgi:CHAT domain-containing protein
MTVSCPEPEQIAVYLDGRLDEPFKAELEQHLAGCEDCYALVAETIHIEQALPASEASTAVGAPASATSHRRWSTWVGMAALVLIAVAAILWTVRRDRAPMSRLAAALGDQRLVEPRLSGFGHAKLKAVRSHQSRVDPDLLDLYSAAAAFEREARRRDASSELMGAVGVARLLLNDLDDAVTTLEQASQREPRNAGLASDLAAAYLVRAKQQGQAADWPRALQAAEQAIAADAERREAHFNRALALEGLSLMRQAREAWEHYLRLDPSSGWAVEAREHLARLTAAPSAEAPSETTARAGLRAALDGGSDQALRRAIAAAPYSARLCFEEELLPAWGAEALAGRDASPAFLRAARLAEMFGGEDALAQDTRRTIESAGGPAIRTALARGHVAYGRGKVSYEKGRFLEALAELQMAAAALERGGSPFVVLPRYYIAVIRRTTDPTNPRAAETLDELVTHARNSRYLDVLGRLLRLRGLRHVSEARYTEALADYAEAIQSFELAALTEATVSLHSLTAESLDLLGDEKEGWARRVRALEGRTRVSSPRQRHVILFDAASAAMDQALPEVALPLANELLQVDFAWGDPAGLSATYRLRALAHDRLGRHDDADSDLAEAKLWLARSAADNPRLAQHEATAAAMEGEIASLRQPARAIPALDAALDHFVSARRQTRLPPLYLFRGRAHAALGQDAEAERDFQRGIEAFEAMRRSLAPERQVSFFDQTWDLFDEMIALEVRRGSVESALAYGERARARQLLEALAGPASLPVRTRAALETAWQPMTPAELQRHLPAGTAIVYYTVLEHRLLAWRLDREACRLFETPLPAAELRRIVGRYRTALERPDPEARESLEALSETLGRILLRPLSGLRDESTALLFVPDDVLQRVPFAALRNPRTGRYLVADHAVGLAPSGTVFVRASAAAGLRGEPRVLVVGNPLVEKSDGAPRADLPQAEAEAAEIAALYPAAESLTRGAATRARFLDRLAQQDVIHFGGHAVSDSQVYSLSHLLLTPEAGVPGSGDLFIHEIPRRQLQRTQLVVLAACRTGAGPLSRGEGVLSLARPLLAKGVPAVVASLWDVDDEASRRVFVAFHRAYRETGSPMGALRRAQLAMLGDPDVRLRHPSLWAPYVAIGGDPSLARTGPCHDCAPPRGTLQASHDIGRQ